MAAATAAKSYSGDRVLLRGLVFYARHGVLPEERTLGQRFVVDADVHADLRDAGRTDATRDTVDYAAVFNLIRKTVEGPPYYNLVAEMIAERVLDEHPRADGVRVRVTKPHVAIQASVTGAVIVLVHNVMLVAIMIGVVTSLGVEIWRTREDMHREGQGREEGSEAEARAEGRGSREGKSDSETVSPEAKVPGGKTQFETGGPPY
eukprot:jgi/Chlat1/6877/Chrsp51S09107